MRLKWNLQGHFSHKGKKVEISILKKFSVNQESKEVFIKTNELQKENDRNPLMRFWTPK